MGQEKELLDLEIDKIKAEIGDTSIGLSMLGIFFIALIPLFYCIIEIYNFTANDIQLPLIISITIILLATIMTILHWVNNTDKLKKLYDKKIGLINSKRTKVK